MASAQDDFGILSEDAYRESGTGSPPPGWTRLTVNNLSYASDPNNGFYAAAYGRFNDNGTLAEVVIAYRGSEGAGDATSVAQLIAGQKPDQYEAAKAFYQDVLTEYGSQAPISLTGHSLGGSLASLVAAEQAAAGNLVVANVINAVGVKNSLDDIGINDPNINYSNIHNYNAVFDPASNVPFTDQIGEINTVVVSSFQSMPTWYRPFIATRHPAILPAALLYFLLDQHSISSFVSTYYSTSQLPPRRDPLTFDLDGDGLETIALNTTNPIMFDHDGDGNQTATGWISPDDAFLVLDRNGNGTIDNGTELFGDSTPVPDGQGGTRNAVDGFDALAAQDTNADGVVNNQDANFANLRLWRDLNQNGTSEAGELTTLAQNNIASISVAKTENNTLLPNGNVIADLGHYTKTDGTEGTLGDTAQLGDIDLREDTFLSQFTDTIPLTPEAEALPGMQGSGQVRDLREAVSQSSNLTTLLTSYSSATTRNEQLSQLDALIQAWSDTSTMATTATGAYAGHPLTVTFTGITNGTPEYQAWLDKLTILERFNGRTFHVVPAGTDPVTISFSTAQMDFLTQSYDALKYSVYDSLILQTLAKPLLDSIALVTDVDGNVALDFSQMETLLNQGVQQGPQGGTLNLVDFINAAGADLKNSGWKFMTFISDAIDILSSSETGRTMLDDPQSWGIRDSSFIVGDLTAVTPDGTANADIILAGGGDDTFNGRAGDDLLIGASGADILYGESGDDVLEGGTGNDTLYGGATYWGGTFGLGSDTYVFNLGDGQDTIIEMYDPYIDGPADSYTDVIRFGAGITPAMLSIEGANDDLVIKINGTTDQITIKQWFSGVNDKRHRVENIEFADGTVQNISDRTDLVNVYTGTAGNDNKATWDEPDVMYGLGGNDNLTGGDGNDQLFGGDGTDTLTGNGGADLLDGGADNDTLQGHAGNDTLYGGDGADILYGESGDDVLEGGTGNDTLYGGADNDVFQGGTGNDTFYGGDYNLGYGNDTYIFNLGDGLDGIADWDTTAGNQDTIRFNAGIMESSLTFGRVGNDLLAYYGNQGDRIQVYNWYAAAAPKAENWIFIDGASYIFAELQVGTINSEMLDGGSSDSILYADAGDDILNGNGGNDLLHGGLGADTMTGGTGNDTYVVDDALDTVTENLNEGTDTVQSSITYTLGANVENLTLTGSANLFGYGNELDNVITGNSGANNLRGGAGNDTLYAGDGGTGQEGLYGEDGDDIIYGGSLYAYYHGGAGNDTLYAGSGGGFLLGGTWGSANTGNDTLIGGEMGEYFMAGDGNDTLSGNGGNDHLDGGAGVDAMTGGTGNDTYTVDDALDTVTENLNEGTDTVQSSITYTLGANVENLYLIGGATDGTGNELNNVINGNGTANVLQGLDGDDTLSGNGGNDTLDGGVGNDTLNGGAGNDTYQFGIGGGQDTLTDNDATAGNTDTVNAGINPLNLVFSQSGDNLLMSLHGTTDSLSITSWYTGTANQTEVFQAADGSTLANTQVDQLIQAMAQFSANNGGITWDQAIDQNPNDVQAVISAYWQAG